MISGLILGLGFWWAVRQPERRTWHDLLSGSYVVNRGSNIARTLAVGALAVFIAGLNCYFAANIANTLARNQLLMREGQTIIQDLTPKEKLPEKIELTAPEEI